MVVDLLDELVELWTVPVVLYVGAWPTEVNVEQLSKDQTHRSLGRPRHRLQQQRYNGLLYRIRQTHFSPVKRSLFDYVLCTNKQHWDVWRALISIAQIWAFLQRTRYNTDSVNRNLIERMSLIRP